MPAAKPFVAIDFETATYARESACALAVVRAEGDRIARSCVRLIRPPSREFRFTYYHGITWEDVAGEPTFGPVFEDLLPLLDGAEFLAAHNASFDRAVLAACCRMAGLRVPEIPFVCTVRLARQAWAIRPTTLPDVCRWLCIPLRHHDPLSDAQACAQIVLAARADEAMAASARERA